MTVGFLGRLIPVAIMLILVVALFLIATFIELWYKKAKQVDLSRTKRKIKLTSITLLLCIIFLALIAVLSGLFYQ